MVKIMEHPIKMDDLGGVYTHLFLVQHPDEKQAIFFYQTERKFRLMLSSMDCCFLKETALRIEKDGLDATWPLAGFFFFFRYRF